MQYIYTICKKLAAYDTTVMLSAMVYIERDSKFFTVI